MSSTSPQRTKIEQSTRARQSTRLAQSLFYWLFNMGKYTEQYTQLHNQERYGFSSENKRNAIIKLIPEDAVKVLDYGCGQSNLLEIIGIKSPYYYDPSVESRNIKPNEKMDLVICTDVLEHIPEDELTDFLNDLFSYSSRLIITICTREARLLLPNGENPHCTVRPESWWIEQLSQYTNTLIPVPELTIPVDGILGYKTF